MFSDKITIQEEKKLYFYRLRKDTFGISDNTIIYLFSRFGVNYKNYRNSFRIKQRCKNKLIETIKLITNIQNNNLYNIQLELRKFAQDKLKNYKGIRHRLRYPVRGQRTHTNAQTRKKAIKKKAYLLNFT
jgi:ribosomal protein S13